MFRCLIVIFGLALVAVFAGCDEQKASSALPKVKIDESNPDKELGDLAKEAEKL